MYEHPYYAYKVTAFEQDQIRIAAEHRRFIAEHADQIVPREAGAVTRMLRRLVAGRRPRPAVAVCETAHAG